MNSRASWSNIANLDGTAAVAAINRLLPAWVSLLLVVLTGWQIARIVWLLVPGPAAGTHVETPSAKIQPASATSTMTDVQKIADVHLFGMADALDENTATQAQPDEDLADTRLVNLTLNGTVASATPAFSVALISDGGKDQKVYSIDDSIGFGTTLHAIYADRVVLDEKGVLTNLKLPREFANTPVAAVRNRNSMRQSIRNTQSIQSVVSQNLTKLTDVIRPTPYMQNGQPAGYRVYPGRNRKQFAALGLRPGDIIKDIDGQSLNDPTQAMEIFQSLGASEQVTVTVERNGQPETLVLKTSQLDISGTDSR